MKTFFSKSVAVSLTLALLLDPAIGSANLSAVTPTTPIARVQFNSQAVVQTTWVARSIEWIQEAGRLLQGAYQPSRRGFFRRVAAATGGVLLVSRASLHASSAFKPGIGEVLYQKIQLQSFNAETFAQDSVLRQIRGQIDDFIIRQNDVSALLQQSGPTPEAQRFFTEVRETLVQQMMSSPARPEFDRILASLNRKFSEDSKTQADELLYLVLPRYLGQRGFLFVPGFVRLSVPPQQMPSVETMTMLELFSLYRIGGKSSLTRTLWGQAYTMDEFINEGPVRSLDKVLAADPPQLLGQSRYGNVLLLERNIDQHATRWTAEAGTHIDLIPLFAQARWHPDQPIDGRLFEPLYFTANQLAARFAANPPTRATVREWRIEQTRVHEMTHVIDYARGRDHQGQQPLNSWTNYNDTITRWFIANEMDARVTEMRYARPEHKMLQLQDFIGNALGTDDNLAFRLASYNLLDYLLAEIESRPDSYPEIQFFPHPTATRRAQIAAQLANLTPEHIDQAFDAIRAVRELNPLVLQLPDAIRIQDLYAGALHEQAWYEKYAPVGGALLALAGGLFGIALWRAHRAEKIKASTSRQMRRAEQMKNKKGRTGGAWISHPFYVKYVAWIETPLVLLGAPYSLQGVSSLTQVDLLALGVLNSWWTPFAFGLVFWFGHILRALQERSLRIFISPDVVKTTLVIFSVGAVIPQLGLYHPGTYAVTALAALLHAALNYFADEMELHQPDTLHSRRTFAFRSAIAVFALSSSISASRRLRQEAVVVEMPADTMRQGVTLAFQTDAPGFLTIRFEALNAKPIPAMGMRIPKGGTYRIRLSPSAGTPIDVKMFLAFLPDSGGLNALHDVKILPLGDATQAQMAFQLPEPSFISEAPTDQTRREWLDRIMKPFVPVAMSQLPEDPLPVERALSQINPPTLLGDWFPYMFKLPLFGWRLDDPIGPSVRQLLAHSGQKIVDFHTYKESAHHDYAESVERAIELLHKNAKELGTLPGLDDLQIIPKTAANSLPDYPWEAMVYAEGKKLIIHEEFLDTLDTFCDSQQEFVEYLVDLFKYLHVAELFDGPQRKMNSSPHQIGSGMFPRTAHIEQMLMNTYNLEVRKLQSTAVNVRRDGRVTRPEQGLPGYVDHAVELAFGRWKAKVWNADQVASNMVLAIQTAPSNDQITQIDTMIDFLQLAKRPEWKLLLYLLLDHATPLGESKIRIQMVGDVPLKRPVSERPFQKEPVIAEKAMDVIAKGESKAYCVEIHGVDVRWPYGAYVPADLRRDVENRLRNDLSIGIWLPKVVSKGQSLYLVLSPPNSHKRTRVVKLWEKTIRRLKPETQELIGKVFPRRGFVWVLGRYPYEESDAERQGILRDLMMRSLQKKRELIWSIHSLMPFFMPVGTLLAGLLYSYFSGGQDGPAAAGMFYSFWKVPQLLLPPAQPMRKLVPAMWERYQIIDRESLYSRGQTRGRNVYIDKVVRLVLEKNMAYTDFTPEDVDQFILHASIGLSAFEVVKPKEPARSAPVFLLRRHIHDPKKLQFILKPYAKEQLVLINNKGEVRYRDAQPSDIAIDVARAIKALGYTYASLGKRMRELGVSDIWLDVDGELNAPEETYTADVSGSPASIVLHPRSYEPGMDTLRIGLVIKGFVNVLTRVPPGENFEAYTLPKWLVAWTSMETVGMAGVRSGLSSLGVAGVRPLKIFVEELFSAAQEMAARPDYHLNKNAPPVHEEGKLLAYLLEKDISRDDLNGYVEEMLKMLEKQYPGFMTVQEGPKRGQQRKLLPVPLFERAA